MNEPAAHDLLRRLNREIWVATSTDGRRHGGLIATTVNSASLVPHLPRVVVEISKQHHTCELIEASGVFALHLLNEAHLEWVWRFGLSSGREHDKLAGLSWHAGQSGAPILDEAAAWLDCKVEARLDTGDRTVYLASVLDARPLGSEPILTLARVLELAPAERKAQLRTQIERQAALDAVAIEAWRRNPR